MTIQRCSIPTLFVCSLLACGGGGPHPVRPPTSITYPTTAGIYTEGVAIAPNTPTATGDLPLQYSVVPALPDGLDLDPATGTISGTPTIIAAKADFIVTATNGGGNASTTITITIRNAAPRDLVYAVEEAVYTRGQAIVPNLPTTTGGPVASYTVTPPLPAGLELDPVTGIVSGTPTAVTAVGIYLVSASNDGGSATDALSISVNDVPPAELAYDTPAMVCTKGVAATPNHVTATGGEIVSFEATPALPDGLVLDSLTGTISGTPTALAPEAGYLVTARNSGGDASTTVHVTVNDRAPADLVYAVPTASYTLGAAITPNAPRSTGGAVVRYAVTPGLPTGLLLDPVTGVITGTPTVLSPQASYVVTATNTGGSTTATLLLAVNNVAPSALRYEANPAIYLLGVQAPANAASHGGGAVISWSVSPQLPAGLTLDGVTGAIGGTPTAAAGAQDYTVTATNSGGSTDCVLRLQVVESMADPAITLARYVTAGKSGIQARTQPQPMGTSYAWTLSGGTITGGQGTEVLVFTAGSPGPLTATVRVSNGGTELVESATATVVLPPTARIFAQERVFPDTTGILASVPVQKDVTVQWTLVMPGGNVTAGETGQVLTYRAGALLGPYQLAATVENLAGDTDADSRTLQVVTREFLGDVTGSQLMGGIISTVLLDGRVLAVGGAGGELFDPPTATWASIGPMVTPRTLNTATLLRSGKVLLAGGQAASGFALASAEIYDPATRTFSPARSMASARSEHVAVLLADGRVLVAGGGPTPTAAVEIYDPASDTWAPAASMSTARLAYRATLLSNGRVLVTGGWNGDSLDSAERYDPATDGWTAAGTIGIARCYHVAERLPSGKVLVTGGMTFGPGDATATVYDPAANAWSPVGSMAVPRSTAAATVLADGRVLVTGGRQGGETFSSAEVFDETSGGWSPIAGLRQARMEHSSSLLPDGSVLVLGGYVWNGDAVGIVERYVPAAGTWSPWGAPALPGHHTATVLADGRLLVAGGVVMGPYTGIPLASAALYDPATHRWTPTGSMGTPRWDHTATLLADGRVLVVGGSNQVGFNPPSLATAELYDPVSGAWAPAASLAFPRFLHAAVRLSDGRVLIAGGSTNGSCADPARATELYDVAANVWTRGGDLALPRCAYTATLLESGQVLAVGGVGSDAGTSAELYDPSTGQWRATGKPTAPRAEHAAALLADGTVLVSGGSQLFLESSETYDPGTGTWTAAGDLAAPRREHLMLALPTGDAMVIGGYPDDASRYPERFDPVSRTWSRGAPMAAVRDGPTANLLLTGTVMIVGGLPTAPTLFWRD